MLCVKLRRQTRAGPGHRRQGPGRARPDTRRAAIRSHPRHRARPRRILTTWGAYVTELAPRTVPILALARDAAASDPEIVASLGGPLAPARRPAREVARISAASSVKARGRWCMPVSLVARLSRSRPPPQGRHLRARRTRSAAPALGPLSAPKDSAPARMTGIAGRIQDVQAGSGGLFSSSFNARGATVRPYDRL